jgi:hypothetical protein
MDNCPTKVVLQKSRCGDWGEKPLAPKYAIRATTSAKTILIPPLKMGRKVCQWIGEPSDIPKILAIRGFLICKSRSNQRRLASTKNPIMRRKNEKGSKACGRNNKWKFWMPPTHPQLRKGIYVLNIIVQTF